MGIYKDCDIRGTYGQDLFDSHAGRLGQAITHLLGKGEVVVAGDARLSTDRLKADLIESLTACGCRVIDLGTVPTPVFYFARRYWGINTGVMVTASHNPARDNGFKIILGDLPITPEEMGLLQNFMEGQTQMPLAAGGRVEKKDILPEYLSAMQTLVPVLKGLKVVVDCANGVASLVARNLWNLSGAHTHFLFERLDGSFPGHSPNPAQSANLVALQETVTQQSADLGVAYDGDGDRVAFVDEHGRPILNDQAIVLFTRQALKDRPGAVVYDQKCSMIVREEIVAGGGEAVMERSGHTFIKTSFIKLQARYAGEISGHHFIQAINGDDGVMASLFFGQILKQSGKSMSELVAGIRSYPITPDIRIPMDSRTIWRVLEDLQSHQDDQFQLVTLDGVRLEYDDGWGMARPSVTEPVITLRFEGKTKQALNRIMRHFEDVAPDLKGRLSSNDQ